VNATIQFQNFGQCFFLPMSNEHHVFRKISGRKLKFWELKLLEFRGDEAIIRLAFLILVGLAASSLCTAVQSQDGNMKIDSAFLLGINQTSQFWSFVSTIQVDKSGNSTDGFASDGQYLWKFDAENQGKNNVNNAIKVSSGSDSSRLAFGIVITPNKVFVGQGWCYGCDETSWLAVVDRKQWKVKNTLTIPSHGFLDAWGDAQGQYGYYLDKMSVWKVDLQQEKVVAQYQYEADQLGGGSNMAVDDGVAYIAPNFPPTIYKVSLSDGKTTKNVLNLGPGADQIIFPDNILLDDKWIYLACTNASNGMQADNVVFRLDRATMNVDKVLDVPNTRNEGPFYSAWINSDKTYMYMNTPRHLYKIRLSDFTPVDTMAFKGPLTSVESYGAYYPRTNKGFFGSSQQTPPVVSVTQVSL
jgi:hypothetical protein